MIVILETGGIMRRIEKLTPDLIKKIIREEKLRLEEEQKAKLFEQLKILKRIKNRQIKNLSEVKELHEAKKILIKKIKGDR